MLILLLPVNFVYSLSYFNSEIKCKLAYNEKLSGTIMLYQLAFMFYQLG